MKQATAEMAGLTTQFDNLNRRLTATAATATNALKSNGAALSSMAAVRGIFDDVATGQKDFFARQMKINTATEVYTKRLQEQKVTLREAWKNRGMFNNVLREQISLQNASAASWSRMSSGKLDATLYQPQVLAKGLDTARQRLGLFNTMLASGSDQMIKWGKNTQWAGRQLMVGFTVPMMAAGIATGKLAFETDKALTQITKVYGDATTGLQETTDSIKQAAMTTAEFTARTYGAAVKDTLAIQGQLAAAGKTGLELQKATAETAKIAVLGELDWQDAVKASISLTEVYQLSAEQLGQSFAYINAMENQTVLTSDDFVTAIPKVAGVMNALGADLKQTGTLLTAFKAAGIDAAEGANALKSINFRLVATYGKGLETFYEKTGKSLQDIIAQTNGETIPSLEKFAEAIKDLSAPEKIAVTRDVFGIYQGSKALLLLEQMVQKTNQWNQALNVANNSVAENALIMQQELDRLNNAPFKQVQKAVEALKIQLIQVGQQFLKIAAPLVNMISSMVEGFNNLSDGTKAFLLLLGGLAALAGPLVMLTGLFANLVGNVVKFGTSMSNLALRFKITNAEERAQAILAKQSTASWDSQTASTARLTVALERLSDRYLNLAAAEEAAAGRQRDLDNPRIGSAEYLRANPPAGFKYTEGAKTPWRTTGAGVAGRISSENMAMQAQMANMRDEANRLNDQFDRMQGAEKLYAAEAAAAKTAKRMRDLTQTIGGAALGITALTALFNDGTNQWVNGIERVLFTFGMLSSLAPGMMASMFTKIAAGMVSLGGVAKSVGIIMSETLIPKGMRQGASRVFDLIKTNLKSLGIAFGVFGVAAVAVWATINKAIEESRRKMEEYTNSAKSLAEVIGFAYQEAPSFTVGKPMNDEEASRQLAAKWADANKDALEIMKQNAANDISGPVNGIWNEAIAAGLKARMHGAGPDEAKTAVRMVLSALGRNFSDADFNAELHLRKIDFTNQDSVIAASVASLKRGIQQAINAEPEGVGEGIARFFSGGDNDLTAAGAVQVKAAAKEWYGQFVSINETERKAAYAKMGEDINKDTYALYERALKEAPDILAKSDIGNYSDFVEMLPGLEKNTGEALSPLVRRLGLSDEDLSLAKKNADTLKTMIREFTSNANIEFTSNDWRDYFQALRDAGYIVDPMEEAKQATDELTNAESKYQAAISKMGPKYDELSDSEKLAILNNHRLAAGLEETGNIADGFSTHVSKKLVTSLDDITTALQEAGYEAAVTGQEIETSWRNIITNTTDALVDTANDQFDANMDSYVDSVAKKGDAMTEEADKAADGIKNAFNKRWEGTFDRFNAGWDRTMDNFKARWDRASDMFDDRWDKIFENFKKREEAREKAIESSYDKRIAAIDASIEREQEAEEQRQRIFEAEKARISRLADLYNTSIDINAAISSGNLDEAAKLQNTSMATQLQWTMDDSGITAGDASKARIDALENRKTAIELEKDRAIEAFRLTSEAREKALKQQEEMEQRAMDARKVREERELKARQEREEKALQERKAREEAAMNASIEANRKKVERQVQQENDKARRYAETQKASLERELALIRAYVPRNEAEMRAQIAAIDKLYNKYGVKLEGRGKGWANAVADELSYQVGIEGNRIKSVISWSKVGNDIAQAMLKGAFGMTTLEFAKWMNGGAAPAKSVFGDKQERPDTVRWGKGFIEKGGGTGGPDEAHHIGGIAGMGGARIGRSGQKKPSEVDARLLRGEGIVNRIGMNVLGKTGLDAVNEGRHIGVGGGTLGMGFLPAALHAAAGKVMIGETIEAAIKKRLGVPTTFGDKLSMAPDPVVGPNSVMGIASGTIGQVLGQGSFVGAVRPTVGTVTSEFGPRHLLGMKFHNGIDIANRTGTPIYAVQSGRVSHAGWDTTGYGNYVTIDHGGSVKSGYGHNSSILVRAGQTVSKGQRIALMGSTGNSTGSHSHFQTGRNGSWYNPRLSFPNLDVGGMVLRDGLANIHENEAVLTSSLTDQLKQGVANFADGGNVQYNVQVTIEGDVNKEVDIERAVETALQKAEKRRGPKRKITN